ncbi:zinc metalloprotease [Pseudohyphozyma bogoriensis]|nr:zinc metalloprotease [Pseudohyphozyma bogoriensis]
MAEPAQKSHDIPQKLGSFNLVANCPLKYADTSVVKWQSEKTGLKVVWVDVEGPLVQGYFVTVTEIFDDSGRPHTLEHLVFMGSEQYPYKGVLDTLANRMFAQGTNAWTDTTNTTYTVGTAGAEGFLGILPVFLDHVLYPTLTDAGFVTEVHHINGKGESAGVVYSEMNGRENGSDDLMILKNQRTLYNEKNALRSETGGLMSALRVLKVEEIREYHASSYLPHNLTLIVAGRSISPTSLLTTIINEVEPSIIAHNQANGPKPEGWKRPFVESTTAENPPVIKKDTMEVVEFPEKDESVGEVMISWIGCHANDWLTSLAISTLNDYLADSAVSPLYKEFVEIDEPLCTDISFMASNENPQILTTSLSSVPAEHLKTLPEKFKACLAALAKGEIDMKRMESTLERQRLHLLDSIETDAAEVLCQSILGDALFGAEDGSDLGPQLDDVDYKTLAGWTAKQWADLLQKYYVDGSSVTIIGQPSAALSDKLKADENARVAETVKRLGSDGLAECVKKVEDAQKENDKPIPDEIIKKFKVPDVRGIDWIKVDSARSKGVATDVKKENRAQQAVDADGAELPLFVQFDHIQSNFIEIAILLFPDASSSKTVRTLLPVYIDTFFSLPVTRADGTELGFEEVVTQLDADTLSYSIDTSTPLQEAITVKMKVPRKKYEIAVSWLRDLLAGSHFAVDRLKINANKALQNLPSEKRSGSDVAYSTYRTMIVNPDSTSVSMSLLTRADAMPEFAESLKSDPDAVVAEFEAFRRGLLNPKTMRISVKGDIVNLKNPSTTWKTHFVDFPSFDRSELVPVIFTKDVLSPLGKAPSKKVVVFGISSIESSFSYHIAKGPDSWTHPDQPALTVARSVLNAMEGYLWKFIRGAGLAYGANIEQDVDTGVTYYRVYKSPDAYAAFEAAKDLIDSLASGKIEIDELTLESAKSSLAYNTAAKQSTMSDAASASFANQVLRGLPQSYGRDALAKTKDVTVADVQAVIKKWVQPIFDPASSIAGVSSGLVKMESIVERFEKAGFEVEKRLFGKDDEEEGEEGSEEGDETGSEMSED